MTSEVRFRISRAPQAFADQVFGLRINAGSSLIEDQDARIVSKGAGKGEQLLLASGKRGTSLLHGFAEAAGEALDKVQNIDLSCRVAHLLVADPFRAQANIARDISGK